MSHWVYPLSTGAFTTRANHHHHHHHHLWHHTCDQWNTNTRCYNTKNKDVRRFLSWHPIPSHHQRIHVFMLFIETLASLSFVHTLNHFSSFSVSRGKYIQMALLSWQHDRNLESHTWRDKSLLVWKQAWKNTSHHTCVVFISQTCPAHFSSQSIHDLKIHPRIHVEDITQCLIRLCEYTVSPQRIVG